MPPGADDRERRSSWLPSPRLSRLLPFVALLAGTLGCAATRVETQWRDPGVTAQDLAFRRVIVIAQVENETTRRSAEDELVRVLAASPRAKARGMQVAPSYPLITQQELSDVTQMRAKVEPAGFDGAVVMRLIGSDERVTHVPGRYEGFYGMAVNYDPGYTRVDRIVRIETSVYSIPEGKRLWSGVTRTMNPSDVPDLVGEVARAVGAELTTQGLLP